GVTPKAYAIAHRSKRLRDTLASHETVTAAMFDAGYNSSGRFYADVSKTLGMAPVAYKSGGLNTSMKFAVGACSLGAILVAATDKGVSAVLMGDDADALIADLQHRFPNATLIGGDKKFDALAAKVIALVENPSAPVSLPLDVRGTAFQYKVWTAIQAIPAGKTASYSAIAKAIGLPKSARAVALACGANPAAVIIPCHRVVRTGGALSGYRWGIARKRALLDREAAGTSGSVKGPARQKIRG
ncbi:MAG: methylated-DNA--[protein]-cysteine S-methyltransferase, partial [Hyphomicrobium sp.]